MKNFDTFSRQTPFLTKNYFHPDCATLSRMFWLNNSLGPKAPVSKVPAVHFWIVSGSYLLIEALTRENYIIQSNVM